MKNKKIFIISTLVLAAIVLSVGITLSYLSDSDPKENKFNVTKGNVTIQESFPKVETQTMEKEYDKKVQVKNDGATTTPCFVRVFVDFSDSRVRDKASIINDTTTYNTWSEFLSAMDYSNQYWEYLPETDENGKLGGYFYYKKVVQPNETTEPLFTKVKVKYSDNEEDSNIDKITDFDIIVYTETVQTTELNGNVYTNTEWKDAWKSFLQMPTT